MIFDYDVVCEDVKGGSDRIERFTTTAGLKPHIQVITVARRMFPGLQVTHYRRCEGNPKSG